MPGDAPSDDAATIWTIGHSTLAFDDFVALLARHRMGAILDVRRFPGSRRYPWFAREALAANLPAHGIEYAWLPQLGGRRRARAGSPNTGWRNASFQGYADHLESIEFAEGLAATLAMASRRRSALMCAESLWWRCHRALVADVLKLRGIQVLHILGAGAPTPHPWTSPARVVDGRLAYPPAQESLFGEGG
ncbi:DUF488 domain-containing protein [Luteimonas sp. MC1572]|uniref:DUF488 domain-containing protein n=1 Tax=Luteimonas sp. MC1572 TaxID=2799325 RepID=UPI0018F099E0|nr:DUF488 domain-containing protein [Luteimonas sp. MC1572]MBJ6980837.1 DUF488 domain-containing protein [Luteimonas sp. MC1572]QQO02200.1 DUF488 domain-containing protein [Luteimonas sp. MC1572]